MLKLSTTRAAQVSSRPVLFFTLVRDSICFQTIIYFLQILLLGITVNSICANAQQNLMWYDIDHYTPDEGRTDGNGAWWSMNPNSPNTVPNDGNQYRTATPLLGLYTSGNSTTIVQHAYWLKALGVTGIITDWSNLSFEANNNYTINCINNTAQIFQTYSGISAFSAPQIAIAARLGGLDQTSQNQTREILDQAYQLYSQYPNLTVHLAGDSRPLLLLFVDFTQPGWQTQGPQFQDARFNIRFTNGYLENQPSMVAPVGAGVDKITQDWPYWDFVDDKPGDQPGTYRALLRQKYENGQEITEYGNAWVGIHQNGLQWDGVFDVINGQRTFQREIAPFFSYSPEVLMVARFNYAIGWYAQPQEGLNLDTSTMIEPTQEYGFDLFDLVRANLASLRGYAQSTPGYQGASSTNGQYYTYWANWPTQYKLSSGSPNDSVPWELVSSPAIPVPTPAGAALFIRTKNSFGTSPWIQYYPAANVSALNMNVVSYNSGKCLDVINASTSNGAQVQQWDCNGFAQQGWSFIPDGPYFVIVNQLSGKALDDTGASTQNQTIMQQWDRNSQQQQDWSLVPNGAYYYIINRLSGKCLDVTSASTSNGAVIDQYDCNGFAQQNWNVAPR